MIAFLHIPKSGGTSVRTAFEAAGLTVYRPKGDRYTTKIPDRADLERFDLVTGHIPFEILVAVEPDELVTVLRDPVDRWLSHYFAEVGGRPPTDWPHPDVVPSNMTVRMLSSFDSPALDRAVANLARFDHVGRTDRLDATFAHYGLTPATERRSGTRLHGDDVPHWLRAVAVERNRLDIQLIQETRT